MKRVDKQQAIALRLRGKSYNEIRRMLNIPSKGTLSYWFRNLPLPNVAKKKLAHNIFLAQKRGLLKFNRERAKQILDENKIIQKEAKAEIRKLTKHELLLIGIALYWGEGTKSINRTSNGLALANSDPQLIKIYLRFIREVLKVPEEKIRSGIHIHPNTSPEKARTFWSKLTKLPKKRFYIVNQVSNASKFRRPITILPYGTVVIKVNSRRLFYKLRGYIKGLCINS